MPGLPVTSPADATPAPATVNAAVHTTAPTKALIRIFPSAFPNNVVLFGADTTLRSGCSHGVSHIAVNDRSLEHRLHLSRRRSMT
jgi:hypothetical protein